MRIVSQQPLIFVDTPNIDEISVEYRRIHKMLQDSLAITHSTFVCLQDLIDENSSITYGIVKTGDPDPNGVQVVKVENMRSDRTIDIEGLSRVSEAVSQQYARTVLKQKDILVSIKGTIGRISEVPTELEGSNITRDSALVRLKNKDDNEFMMLYLESELAQLQMTLHSRGAAVKGINLSDLREVKVPVIDKISQELIVARYHQISKVWESKIKELTFLEIQKFEKKIDKSFAQELEISEFNPIRNKKIFVRDFKLAERLDVTANHPDYTLLVDQIRRSPTAGILGDLVKVSEYRFNPNNYAGQEVHYLAIGDIDGISGKIIAPQTMLAEELPSRARRIICTGDILIGIAGASTGTENMVVYPVSQEEDGWVATTGFQVLRPKSSVDIEFVCRLLKSPFVLRQIRALLTSPAMPTISEEDLLNISIPVTNENTRKQTLEKINKVISEEQELVYQLDAVSKQINQLISQAKSNIFDLLDDSKYLAMSTKANELKEAMAKIEESLK